MSHKQNSPDSGNTNNVINIESISAITLAVKSMCESFRFYSLLGFKPLYGDAKSHFCSFSAGSNYLNLIVQSDLKIQSFWGRIVFYVNDVDNMYYKIVRRNLLPESPPSNAHWNERYFHIIDPDGHELSFAKTLD